MGSDKGIVKQENNQASALIGTHASGFAYVCKATPSCRASHE
ncbi:hypothetical protein CaCOL14_011677 [Colletotrichum acutatum]